MAVRRNSKYNLRNSVRKIVAESAEKKIYDYDGAFTPTSNPVDWIGVLKSISDIEQGVTDKQRIGDKATLVRLTCRWRITLPFPEIDFVPVKNYTLRVIIFQWKDDTVPLAEDILNATTTIDTNMPVLFNYNHDKKAKFKILRDTTQDSCWCGEETPLSVFGTSQSYAWEYSFDKWKQNDKVINYIGTETDGINKIYILLISNGEVVTEGNNSCWNVYFNSRIKFIDMYITSITS